MFLSVLQEDVSTLQSEPLRSYSMCQVHLTGGHGPRGRIQVQGETAGFVFMNFTEQKYFYCRASVQSGSLKRAAGLQSLGRKICIYNLSYHK